MWWSRHEPRHPLRDRVSPLGRPMAPRNVGGADGEPRHDQSLGVRQVPDAELPTASARVPGGRGAAGRGAGRAARASENVMKIDLSCLPISKSEAARLVVANHYLHRRPPISFSFGLIYKNEKTVGVVTFGTPASRHMLISACKSDPSRAIELNRLWVSSDMPRNSESFFVSRALSLLPPRIVLSYADTAVGHFGYVYRALNFHYAGWTDMDRKTPRFDYITPGKHSRDSFRNGKALLSEKVRRKPKARYWTVTGNRRERKILEDMCLWPKMNWKQVPPPGEFHAE